MGQRGSPGECFKFCEDEKLIWLDGFIKHPIQPLQPASTEATVHKMEAAIQLTFWGDDVMKRVFDKSISWSSLLYSYTSYEIQN